MPDDKKKVGKPDSQEVNVNEPYELKYWAKELQVTPTELKKLVDQHGPWVKNIRKGISDK